MNKSSSRVKSAGLAGVRRSSGGRTGSVMTPLVWMCGISELILIPSGLASHDDWFAKGCFSVAVFVVLFYAAMYLYFAIRDPNRLQTEDYNIVSEEMRLQVGSATTPALVVQAGSHPQLVQSPGVPVVSLPQLGVRPDSGDGANT